MGKSSTLKKQRRARGFSRVGSRIPAKYDIFSLEYIELDDCDHEQITIVDEKITTESTDA